MRSGANPLLQYTMAPQQAEHVGNRQAAVQPLVFVSYSHFDQAWRQKVADQLDVAGLQGLITTWHDQCIDAGDDWRRQIESAIDSASIAVLLISEHFLTSQFILSVEVPRLLARRDRFGLRIIPIIVRPCAWQAVRWLQSLDVRPKGQPALAEMDESLATAQLAEVAREIALLVGKSASRPRKWVPLPPDRVSTGLLPPTNSTVYGRDAELGRLDTAWDSPSTNLLSVVAWGGVGKSSLINHWLGRLRGDQYRGAERVFGWSFYGQGTAPQVMSADLFVHSALAWFDHPVASQPWENGQRLADAIRKQRTLLVLDGLEPMQFPPGANEGRLRDQSLQVLLRELAAQNRGLCLLTSRLPVADVADFEPQTAQRLDLGQISVEAGVQLLRSLGVVGQQRDFEDAVRAFDGHCLALTLLGSYLTDACHADIRRWREIGPLQEDARQGSEARGVMARYEQWFGQGPELAVLRMLGLFNGPADRPAIEALLAGPRIPGITDQLQGLSSRQWEQVLGRLRRARLLTQPPGSSGPPQSGAPLDAHPLVREHFASRLRELSPEGWRAGNRRLYDHLRTSAKPLPSTLDEMMPLYAAVAHGCAAGMHGQALARVYWPRIRRKYDAFSTRTLGAFDTDLAALAQFFDPPFSALAPSVPVKWHGAIRCWTGYRLQALGRLAEARPLLAAAVEDLIKARNWRSALRVANNLASLSITLGDLPAARAWARRIGELPVPADLADEVRAFQSTSLGAIHFHEGRMEDAATACRAAFPAATGRDSRLSSARRLSYATWFQQMTVMGIGQDTSIDDDVFLERVGDGSGLLDLNREEARNDASQTQITASRDDSTGDMGAFLLGRARGSGLMDFTVEEDDDDAVDARLPGGIFDTEPSVSLEDSGVWQGGSESGPKPSGQSAKQGGRLARWIAQQLARMNEAISRALCRWTDPPAVVADPSVTDSSDDPPPGTLAEARLAADDTERQDLLEDALNLLMSPLARAGPLQDSGEDDDDLDCGIGPVLAAGMMLKIRGGEIDYVDRPARTAVAAAEAVRALRKAGFAEYLALGLLNEARCLRLSDQRQPAKSSLDEALAIAERGEMLMILAECRLEAAAQALPVDRAAAQRHLDAASALIDRIGCHRLDKARSQITDSLKSVAG